MRVRTLVFIWLAVTAGCTCSIGKLKTFETCDNHKDDNGDGLVDCADPGCFNDPACFAPCADLCQDGDVICTADGPQACHLESFGCRDFGPVQPCPSPKVCSGAQCVSDCTDQCTEGARLCVAAAATLTCQRLATGCLDWASPRACDGGTVCSEGACVPPGQCQDECTEGSSRCTQGGLNQRCGHPMGACTQWGLPVACPSGQSCGASGVCGAVGDAGSDGGADAGSDAGLDAGLDGGADADAGPCRFGLQVCDAGCCAPSGWCSSDGWCWANPLPQGNAIHALYAPAPNDVWAVGSGGLAMHYDGARWSPTDSGTHDSFHSISGFAPNQLYALSTDGYSGAVSTWNGTAWAPLPALPNVMAGGASYQSLWGSSPTDLWAFGLYANSTAYASHWNGSGWVSGTMPSGSRMYGASATGADVWAVGDWGGGASAVNVLDAGTWTSRPGPDGGSIFSTWAFAPNDRWLAQAGQLTHWDGAAFTAYPMGTAGYPWFSTWGARPDDVWAAGYADGIAHFDGGAWSLVPQTDIGPLSAVAGTSASDVWAGGAGGNLLHYDGNRWTPIFDSITPWLAGISGTGPNDLWAVGGTFGPQSGPPAIAHSDGTRWSSVPVPAPYAGDARAYLVGVTSVSATDAWAVGMRTAGPFALRLSGTVWTDAGNLPLQSVYGVWAADSTHVFAVGGGDPFTGPAKIAMWNGSQWALSTCGQPMFFAVHGTSASDVWAVGWDGLTCHFDGASWTQYPTGLGSGNLSDVFESVHVMAADDAWAGTGDGQVFHWNGTNWTSAYSFQQNSYHSLTGIWGSSSNDFYVVGGVGYFFDYFDGDGVVVLHHTAAGWTQQNPGLNHYLSGIWGSGSTVWAVGALGTVITHP